MDATWCDFLREIAAPAAILRDCAARRERSSAGRLHSPRHDRAPNARDATAAAIRIHTKNATHEDAATITNPIAPELIAPRLGLVA
jgi:hypothetical protein